jgi:hypothetical protein
MLTAGHQPGGWVLSPAVKGWVESPMLGCVTLGSSPSGEPDDKVICIDRKSPSVIEGVM